jgi:translation initiation factor IF-2
LAKKKRVFELAKELGVKSKAIVEKCQAEGVPDVTNHMSTVKTGLEMTIREWFGQAEGETPAEAEAESESQQAQGQTAVETAERVDMTKAKAQKRKTARKASKSSEKAEGEEAAASSRSGRTSRGRKKKAEAAAAAEQPRAEEQAHPAEPQAAEAAASGQQTEEAQPTAHAGSGQAQAQQEAPSGQETGQQARSSGPRGEANVPNRPQVIKPAGDQLDKPEEAKLKGPKVVRVEEPETAAPSKQRGPRRREEPAPSAGGASAGGDDVPGISRSKGPSRGRGAGGGGAGGGEESGGRRRGKRRSLNTRRGRSGDALPSGPAQFSQADMEELDARLKGASGYLKQRRRDMRKREQSGQTAQTPAAVGGKVEIEEPITIKDLSAATGIKSGDILKYLFRQGVMANINSAIDSEAAMEVALEYGIELEVQEQQTAEEQIRQEFEQREPIEVRSRPPVVTVLGHVDHGKTSLLDKIRQADVAVHEAGGITQHVGAYRVTVEGSDAQEKTVVFLDTPGHEAFTQMRSRGAQMTDMVVLVVAADDGVMPQTVESINHTKAAGVPIVVALNKIDTPQATDDNIHRIYGQLAEHGLNPTEWGGSTEIVKTSAETWQGITDLLEIMVYEAEIQEYKADYGGAARGTVIEAEMQTGRGAVARVLVQEGQLKVGDFIVVGRAYGRVREMTDDRGRSIDQAGPATPVELSGIDEIPDAGDKFYVTDSLRKAEEVAQQYRDNERNQQLARQTRVTLDNFAEQLQAGQAKELRVVLKADVQGSLDVIRSSLEQMGNQEVRVRVLHSAVGGVTESDVLLADASDAVVVGFNVGITPAVREIADEHKVDVRLYRVIYELTDNVKAALEGLLEPETREEHIGSAEVREVFKVSRVGNVAGCVVSEGAMRSNGKVRVERDGQVVTDGRNIESLKRVKEDVREVRAGTECGVKIAGFDDVKKGDQIICYNLVEVKRTLEDAAGGGQGSEQAATAGA